MMTQDDVNRLSSRVEETITLNPQLRPEILKEQIKDTVTKIETRLKRTKASVVVMIADMK